MPSYIVICKDSIILDVGSHVDRCGVMLKVLHVYYIWHMLCSHVCAALYLQFEITFACAYIKPIFHLATFFARRQAKTRIRQHDWLKLAGEKIRREQVGSVPTFLSVRRTNSPSGK